MCVHVLALISLIEINFSQIGEAGFMFADWSSDSISSPVILKSSTHSWSKEICQVGL